MGSGISDVVGSVQGIQSLFGHKDKNATNDTKGGQVVATGTPGAQTVADPNQGLSTQQMAARKALLAGLGSLGSMSQPQPQQPMSPLMPIPQSPAPNFIPQMRRNAFFGQ